MTPQTTQETRISLYALTDDLSQMLVEQADMLDAGEDTSAIALQIQTYLANRIPERVDAAVHVSKSLKVAEQFAADEEDRLKKRKLYYRRAWERLNQYLVNVLELLPAPARGLRRLEGHSSRITLCANSGKLALEYDENVLPPEYFRYAIELSYSEYCDYMDKFGPRVADRFADTDLIRREIETPCVLCEAKPTDEPCPRCGGDGLTHIPGARLAPRGSHVRMG